MDIDVWFDSDVVRWNEMDGVESRPRKKQREVQLDQHLNSKKHDRMIREGFDNLRPFAIIPQCIP